MRKNTTSLLIFVLAYSFCIKGFTQQTSDTELWAGAEVKYNVTERLRMGIDHQQRFENNVSARESSFNHFSLRVKLAKYLFVKPAYRFTTAPEINENNNRFSTDVYLTISKKGTPLKFTNRLRYQYSKVVNKEVREWALRNRLGVEYKLNKRFEPFTTYELFYGLEEFYRMRFRFGTEWKASKRISLDIFYGYERQIGRRSNDSTHIISVNSSFNFKRKKRK